MGGGGHPRVEQGLLALGRAPQQPGEGHAADELDGEPGHGYVEVGLGVHARYLPEPAP